MQDFNYVHSNCMEVTFELSCCKFPSRTTLATEWANNKESLLAYMEVVSGGVPSVRGLVLDGEGEPVLDADVWVEQIARNVTSSHRGEFWRLLPGAGTYTLRAAATGCVPSPPINITVPDKGPPLVQNITLQRLPRSTGNYY